MAGISSRLSLEQTVCYLMAEMGLISQCHVLMAMFCQNRGAVYVLVALLLKSMLACRVACGQSYWFDGQSVEVFAHYVARWRTEVCMTNLFEVNAYYLYGLLNWVRVRYRRIRAYHQYAACHNMGVRPLGVLSLNF